MKQVVLARANLLRAQYSVHSRDASKVPIPLLHPGYRSEQMHMYHLRHNCRLQYLHQSPPAFNRLRHRHSTAFVIGIKPPSPPALTAFAIGIKPLPSPALTAFAIGIKPLPSSALNNTANIPNKTYMEHSNLNYFSVNLIFLPPTIHSRPHTVTPYQAISEKAHKSPPPLTNQTTPPSSRWSSNIPQIPFKRFSSALQTFFKRHSSALPNALQAPFKPH
jgi:hypothetical protein